MEFLAQFHPMVVHFPIAFLLGYVLLEVIGVVSKKEFFSKSAHLLLLLGVLGALVAVFTGGQAAEVAAEWLSKGANISLEAINQHEEYANITLWYFAGVLVLRTFLVIKKKFTGYFKYIFLILAVAGTYFVYQTGEHGGRLVYDKGVGTQLMKAEINK